MSRASTLVTAMCLLGWWAAPAPAASQEAHGVEPSGSAPADVGHLVAEALGVAVERIRVDLQGRAADADMPPPDSVAVRRGSGHRWLLTSWSGGMASLRFLDVEIVERVAVAARDLPRGHAVTSEDVLWEERFLPAVDTGAFVDPVGMVTERAVRDGDLLEAPSVRPPLVIRGGETVEAVLDEGAVRMSMRATALASAREGGRLPVRLESGRRFEATAVDRGVVRLVLGGSR